MTERTLSGVLIYADTRVRLAELAAERSAAEGRTVSLAQVVEELLEASGDLR